MRTLPLLTVLAACSSDPQLEQRPHLEADRTDIYTVIDSINGQTELFSVEDFADGKIFVLEFAGDTSSQDRPMLQQARTMNRIVAFIEQEWAPKDQVLEEDELKRRIEHLEGHEPTKYNYEGLTHGQNYSSTQLVSFFNTAIDSEVTLNEDEEWLKRTLIENGIIIQNEDGRFEVPNEERALLTFAEPQEDNTDTPKYDGVTEAQRIDILAHELSHGWYAAIPSYTEFTENIWNEKLNDEERENLIEALANYYGGYDTDNLSIVMNETQAYLLHSGSNGRTFTRLIEKEKLAEIQTDFMSTQGLPFLHDDLKVYSYTGGKYECLDWDKIKADKRAARVAESEKYKPIRERNLRRWDKTKELHDQLNSPESELRIQDLSGESWYRMNEGDFGPAYPRLNDICEDNVNQDPQQISDSDFVFQIDAYGNPVTASCHSEGYQSNTHEIPAPVIRVDSYRESYINTRR